ncbi:hypothetical protein [Pseudomonas sp. BF-R-24]|nr:hypothetical protein [Pseudomonas sp. BF-R-24]
MSLKKQPLTAKNLLLRIAKLPKTKQKFVIDMLDAMLAQQG